MIPFNRSSLQGNELAYIHETIGVGQVAGDQTYSRKCQQLLEEVTGCGKALVTTSCTHALEAAALLLGIGEGDEVIIPDFTFVSTANAFVIRGARPVFCDIRPDTLNLDENLLEALITPRTKAIVPVHYAGVGCEMDAIGEIAVRHGVAVIEDNAHGLFGKYKGRWLGTSGALAAQSFHETKNITCGEGGALLINDAKYVERAEIIREKGTNRARFFRGQVDKYSWVDVGSSYVMSDVLAAFLYGQLEQWEVIQRKRRTIWGRYDQALGKWSESRGIRRPVIPEHCEQAYHMYHLLMPSLDARTEFIGYLAGKEIKAVFHYLPLSRSEYALQAAGRKMASGSESSTARRGDRRWEIAKCPVSEDVSDRLVRLPFYTSMSSGEQDQVIEAILEWRKAR
ncbi:MAG: dTDP-4-amino-4,6-dideoxygalactose transaminase [Chthoniobacterales bacterium]|nr:dTDP-4-amino-4,6-dideoxygalactose transaminase [Chthoniobacterales bacterium]